MVALMSALQSGQKLLENGSITYQFNQKVCIMYYYCVSVKKVSFDVHSTSKIAKCVNVVLQPLFSAKVKHIFHILLYLRAPLSLVQDLIDFLWRNLYQ